MLYDFKIVGRFYICVSMITEKQVIIIMEGVLENHLISRNPC